MSRFLIDMDGVIADWGKEWDIRLNRLGPVATNIPRHNDQRDFNLKKNLNQYECMIVDDIMNSRYFYTNLEPINSPADDLDWLVDEGNEVFIVTTPTISNVHCIPEKCAWIESVFGRHWLEWTIFTHDKTIIDGDWLIDDKPEIKGLNPKPSWTRIIFDQPYNRLIQTGFRIFDLSELRLLSV